MRLFIPAMILSVACAGCVAPPPSERTISQATVTIPPDDPACRDYTAQATIDGEPQPIVGRACRQPDGSWKITEGPPGQAGTFAGVYTPPPYPAYTYLDPWLWGPPIGLSLGAIFFVDRDHHIHEGRRFFHGEHTHDFDGHHNFGHAGPGGARAG